VSRWGGHVRNRLLTGLLFLLPAVLTVWLVVLLFGAADRAFTRYALALLETGEPPSATTIWASRIVALASVILVLYVVGALAANVVGQRLLAFADEAVQRVPGLGPIYRALRQALDAFGPGGGTAFRRCVLIEYPRRGVWRMAFVTNDRGPLVGDPPRPTVAVFVPMSPYPASGFLVLVPPDDCVPLAITVEEGLKMVVTGGVVLPGRLAGPGGSPLPAGAAVKERE
jgi:uncharacterized membrane protein